MIFDRLESAVQDCPAETGLNLMRERIAWLDEQSLAATQGVSAAAQ